ncbi:MAG: ABC transporter permease, partial [Thermoleophilia bacterium]
ARMKSMEGFQMIMNFFLMPMFFLSGAMFPLQNLPTWMKMLVEMNPLSYGVDIMRYTVIGVNTYPIWRDLAVIIGFGVLMIGLAVFEFGRTE